MNPAEFATVKVAFVGNTGTGKSSIALRASEDNFSADYIPTVAYDFKQLLVDQSKLKLQLWDSAGKERFRNVVASMFNKMHGFALVFDVSDRASFEAVTTTWLADIKRRLGDSSTQHHLLLIGNKTDAPDRAVSASEAEELAAQHRMMYLECSSKDGNKEVIVAKLVEFALKSLL